MGDYYRLLYCIVLETKSTCPRLWCRHTYTHTHNTPALLRSHFPHSPEVDDGVQHVVCHVLQVANGVDDDGAGDAGREEGEGGGEGERGEQLLSRLLLLELLEQEDQLHAHRREPPATGAVEHAVAEQGAQQLLVRLQPVLALRHPGTTGPVVISGTTHVGTGK